MYQTNLTPPKMVTDKRKDAQWPITMFDSMSEAADAYAALKATKGRQWQEGTGGSFVGDKSSEQTMRLLRDGDTSAVSESDKLLSRFEQFLSVKGSKFQIVDDVAGAVPNVPAYLAGHPLTMRRRQRMASELAPLTLVVDTCVSAGFSEAHIRQRGVAILALVRALALVRPVQLYAGWNFGTHKSSKLALGVFARIDTSPMDLARAAYPLCHPSFLRRFGFEYGGNSHDQFNARSIPWGFGDADLVRRALSEMMQQILGGEVFAVPGMYAGDNLLNKPVAWIFKYLKEYGGEMFSDLPDPSTMKD